MTHETNRVVLILIFVLLGLSGLGAGVYYMEPWYREPAVELRGPLRGPVRMPTQAELARGYLGFGYEAAPDGQGVIVVSVSANGPAERAGLQAGDVIVSVNGRDIADMQMFVAMGDQWQPGEAIDLRIMRDGKPMALKGRTISFKELHGSEDVYFIEEAPPVSPHGMPE